MELSFNIAEEMLEARLRKFPEMNAIISAPFFREELMHILAFHNIPESLYDSIETEILLVLTRYASILDLPKNLSEATQLPFPLCEQCALSIETLLFQSVQDQLNSFAEYVATEKTKEDMRNTEAVDTPSITRDKPQERSANATTVINKDMPLTREDVSKVIGIPEADADTQPIIGYAAYRAKNNPTP
jgi:hypothetical protein